MFNVYWSESYTKIFKTSPSVGKFSTVKNKTNRKQCCFKVEEYFQEISEASSIYKMEKKWEKKKKKGKKPTWFMAHGSGGMEKSKKYFWWNYEKMCFNWIRYKKFTSAFFFSTTPSVQNKQCIIVFFVSRFIDGDRALYIHIICCVFSWIYTQYFVVFSLILNLVHRVFHRKMKKKKN